MQLIGIGGTNGAGKDTVAKILVNDYGWQFISSSENLIIPELKKRGLPIERTNMSALTTEWRQAMGMGAVVDKALEKFKADGGKGLVVGSLRHPGEADRVHELGGQVIWVDADPKVRYQRINNRGQGAKDQKTFEQFLAEEQAEMNHSGHEATLATGAIKDKADIFITNNGNLNAVKAQVKAALKLA